MEQEPQSQITTTSFLIMDDSSAEETEPLTPLRIQFLDEFIYDVLMASSDVDQKFLGKFAQQTQDLEPYLSEQLYKILGLSVLLSKKLFRARRLRRLDVTRDTKSLQLYHHIIWLSREGLVILEVAVLPAVMSNRLRVPDLAEMRVLAQKLQGSFYHIFVLFHNQPSINRAAAVPASKASRSAVSRSDSIRKSTVADDEEDPYEQTAGRNQHLPPGLAPIAIPKPTASFLLPAQDYIPSASNAFDRSMKLARQYLGGSHPLRLSVAVEYCAYLYDCLHDAESSRGLARVTIRNVYSANEGMDDETFADSANLVSVLGKMMKRGLGSSTGSKTPSIANTGTTPSSPRRGSHQQQQAPPMPSPSQYPAPLKTSRAAPSQSSPRQHAPSSPRTTRPSHSHSQSYSYSYSQPQAQAQALSSPRTHRSRSHSQSQPQTPSSPSSRAPRQSPIAAPHLSDSTWASSSKLADGTQFPQPPRMPATTNTSPKSPRAAQKLPKMTPWEPPQAGVVKDSPPRIRGGGTTTKTKINGVTGYVREKEDKKGKVANGHGYTNGHASINGHGSGSASGSTRTRTPEEARAKEEKRRRVEVAEKKSRSSEGLKERRSSGSASASANGRTRSGGERDRQREMEATKARVKNKQTSRERLDRSEVVSPDKSGRTRRRRG